MTGAVHYYDTDGHTPLPVTAARPLPVASSSTPLAPAGLSFTDRSISNATGSSETLIAANSSRKALIIVNPASGTNWTVRLVGGTAVADTPPGILLRPGDAIFMLNGAPTNAITGIGTAAAKLTVLEG